MTAQKLTAVAGLVAALGSSGILGLCQGARWEIEMRAPEDRVSPVWVLRWQSREIGPDEPIPWEAP